MALTQQGDYLYRLGNLMGAWYLVVEDDGLTVIDTGSGQTGATLDAAGQLGLSIRRLAATHVHMDHVGALDALAAALPDAQLALGVRQARLVKGDLSVDPGEPSLGSGRAYTHLQAEPRRLLQDGDMLGSLQVLHVPGHTPGHLAFYDTRDGTLIAGDAWITAGRLAVAGDFRTPFPLPSFATWWRERSLESARRMRALNPTRLACGHGPVLENPVPAMDRAIARLGKVLKWKKA